MPLSEILTSVSQLTHQDKLRLIHFLLHEVAKEEGFSLESTPDDEHQKNELIKQLSVTEAVVWSPQTDNQGIQALSELLIAEQRKSNA